MAFEVLLKKSTTEKELLDLIVKEIQDNFIFHQKFNYFFKFQKTGEKTSKINWIKTFSKPKELIDFYFDRKVLNACIMIQFYQDHYKLLCHGFFYEDNFEIWPDQILGSRPITQDNSHLDKFPLPPFELLEGAFGEISQSLATTKHIKAV